MTAERVTLNVAGVEYVGWLDVEVHAAIDQAARAFKLSVVAAYRGDGNGIRIAPGMACAVLFGDDLVVNGYVDSVNPHQDDKRSEIEIVGRSRTCDLVDCSCLEKPGQFAGIKAELIAAELARPYGVEVVAEVDTGAIFGRKATRRKIRNTAVVSPVITAGVVAGRVFGTDFGIRDSVDGIAAVVPPVYGVDPYVLKGAAFTTLQTGAAVVGHTVQPGETVIESVARLAEKRGLLVTDDALGRLVLTRAGTGLATTAIVRGGNVIGGGAMFDASKVFSEYAVRGQRVGTDSDFGESCVNPLGTATDPGIVRFRRLALHSESHSSAADCKKEAQWEAASRLGKSCVGTYKVRGWRQDDGTLWRPNLLVEVRDPFCGLFGQMLIVGVTYSITEEQGTVAVLRLGLAAGYTPKPIKSAGRGRSQSRYWQEIAGGVTDRAGVAYTRAPAIRKSAPAGFDLPDGEGE